MRTACLYISMFLLLAAGCRPKDNTGPAPGDEPAPVAATPDEFRCEELPPPPAPFGWRDSTANDEENVVAFIFNPANNDEIIYVIEGDVTGYNRMYTYNVITKNKIFLGNAGPFLPSVNKYGWVVYSTIDNNIQKVKTNGDSSTRLTSNFSSLCPKWDLSGRSVFYFQQAYASVLSSLVKITENGSGPNFVIPANLPHHATYCKSDKILFLTTSTSSVTIVEVNVSDSKQRDLIQGAYNSKTGEVEFNNLCLDRNDENFFWSNAKGIFRCNLQSLKIDTLLKNCPNITYMNPLISFKNNELSLGFQKKNPISTFILYKQYKALQLDLFSRRLTEVRIFTH